MIGKIKLPAGLIFLMHNFKKEALKRTNN
jgi:hypothetical protein